MTTNRTSVYAALLLALLMSGCYRYVVVASRMPPSGADLMLELTPPRDMNVQNVTVRDVTALQGRLVSVDGDSIAVSVRRLWGLEGRSYEAMGIGVNMPRSAVVVMREKRVSTPRTGFAIAAASAAIAGMILSVRQIIGAGGGSRPKPMP